MSATVPVTGALTESESDARPPLALNLSHESGRGFYNRPSPGESVALGARATYRGPGVTRTGSPFWYTSGVRIHHESPRQSRS